MSDELSSRQRQVLDYLREVVDDRGYPPSVREIGEALGLSSPSTVHSHLSSLVKSGHIRRDPSKPRAIEILEEAPATVTQLRQLDETNVRQVPLVGRIAAGTPILAAEHIEDTMTLPTDLVGTGPIFMLQVSGDSMIDAGILDGDYVVIESGKEARNGEIVAALVDDEEATVKRFRRDGDRVILTPENPRYEPMVFESGVEIIGRVISVFRRL